MTNGDRVFLVIVFSYMFLPSFVVSVRRLLKKEAAK
jgi:hypothetical protein